MDVSGQMDQIGLKENEWTELTKLVRDRPKSTKLDPREWMNQTDQSGPNTPNGQK